MQRKSNLIAAFSAPISIARNHLTHNRRNGCEIKAALDSHFVLDLA
jgi:hypothetical protein